MKTTILKLLSILLITVSFQTQTSAQKLSSQEKKERIQASYMLVTGRQPNSGELDYWMKQIDQTIPQLVDLHKQYIPRDQTFHRNLIIKSYIDALGRRPSNDEINYWMKGVDTYTDLIRKHIEWLKGNPAEYEKTIKRSYKYALGRLPNTDELNWWKQQGVYSFIALSGCHSDWARRNNQGAKNTISSMASTILQMIPISTSKVTGEIKSFLNIPILGNVLSIGAEKIQTALGNTMLSSAESLISNFSDVQI